MCLKGVGICAISVDSLFMGFFMYVFICVLQKPSIDISGAPWGDIHHSECGPLSAHADPQQVSYPTAAKGNRQR